MPIPRTENGWGSVHNGGITGGAGGIEMSFDNFPDMWIWMNANKTTPAIVTYTGANFSREGFPRVAPNSTFSNGTRFEIIGLENKTIRASAGQRLDWCEIRFLDGYNCIWENWDQRDSLEDLVDIINDSENIWIRHCRLNQNVFNQTLAPTDGNIDIGIRSNYIAVTDCIIENGEKTMLISFSNNEPNDVGKMKVTIRRCKFQNNRIRKPMVRYGQIGIEYCVFDDRDMTGFTRVVEVGKLSRVWTYRNTFRGGASVLFQDRASLDSLSLEDSGALRSVENVISGSYGGGLNEIRPENVDDLRDVTNYTLENWTPAEAAAWVDQWAGPNMHLMTDDEVPPTIPPVEQGNRRFFARRNPIF
jgi:pectate lyase